MQPFKASELRVELIHGGDAAGHQRRLTELLAQLGDALVVDVQFSVIEEPNTRAGIGYSTMILYRPAAE